MRKVLLSVILASAILASAEDKVPTLTQAPTLDDTTKLAIRTEQVKVLQNQINTIQANDKLKDAQLMLNKVMFDAFQKAGIKPEDYQLDADLNLTPKSKPTTATARPESNEKTNSKKNQ